MSIVVCHVRTVVRRTAALSITPHLRSIAGCLSDPPVPGDAGGMTILNETRSAAQLCDMLPRGRRHNRATILEVTRRLLQRKGLAQISMEEIAAEAGLSRRTIYNHFENTSQLFELAYMELVVQLAPLVPLSISDKMPLDLALAKYCRQASRLFTDARHRQLQLSLMREDGPWLLTAYDDHIGAPMLKALTEYLSERWPAVPAAEIAELGCRLLSLIHAACVVSPPFHRFSSAAWEDVAGDILVRTILSHRNELP
jgi:AcrR family transcriptional regulator